MRALRLGFILFTFSGFALFFSSTVSAQTNHRAGVLHVKFKSELSQQLAGLRVRQSSRGTAITGITAVDQISAARGVRSFRRIFREAGKFEAAHRAYGLHLWYEIEFDSTFSASQVRADYAGTDQFEIVEQPKKVYQIGPAMTDAPPEVPLTTNDPLFGDQWHYENTGQTGGKPGADISLVSAWSLETGSSQVIVAVIDGGIDIRHPDLTAAMWINTDEIAGNGIDDDLNGYIDDVNGYGFGDNTGTLHPNFHGTHVGGTVGAVTNNGIGVSGIAGGSGTGNGVRLMSCAGFGLIGVGGFEDAMVYAADNGAVISQNSWGGGSTAIEDAIDYFIARAGLDNSAANFGLNIQIGPMRGGIVIFAAGNSNTNDPNVGYPASYAPVMAVASTDHNDKRSTFSNYGTWVDIAAPGSAVFSTYPVGEGSYALLSGTSMACPHVSGAAALVVSKFKGPGLNPTQVWGRLRETADNIDAENPAFVGALGSGRLNAFHALQSDDGIPPAPITDLAVADELLTSIRLTWTASGGSGLVGTASYYDLRYSTTPITEGNFAAATSASSVPKPKVSGSTEVVEITGLLPTTTYYFAVKAGDYFGNLSSLSNVVSATTLEPPIIGVSPSSLSQTLFTGAQATQVLRISNTGVSDLIFDIATQTIAPSSVSTASVENGKIFAGLKPAGPAQSGAYRNLAAWQSASPAGRARMSTVPVPLVAGRVFLLSGPTQISELSPVDGTILHMIPTPETASGGPDGLAFDGKHLYFVNSFGTGKIYKIDAADGSVAASLSFPEAGVIDALGHSGSYLYALNYSNGTIYEIDFDAGIVVRSIATGIPLGGGLSFGGSRGTLFVSNFESSIHEIDLRTGEIVRSISPKGTIYGLGYSEGAGLLFAQNVNLGVTEAYNPDTGEVELVLPSGFSSALASDEGGNQWLKVGEGSVVPAGQTVEVEITFDANGLNGGDYLGQIRVESNDPVTPLVTVPASLRVIGAPNIALLPAAVDFGDVLIGQSHEVTVNVGNSGTDELTVNSFSMVDPGFSIISGGATPFSLAPGESHSLIIRFSPIATGEVTGNLLVDSDDPDQPSLAFSLRGKGIEAPVIEVAPDSISAHLFSGESENHSLTVHNSGGSKLLVDVDIEFQETAPSSVPTMQPTPSSGPNNYGVVLPQAGGGYYPQVEGDFSVLANAPAPLTCFTIDPTTQNVYGQRNGGNQFYQYNPTTNLWTTLASCPVMSGNNGGAAYLKGKIYTIYTDNNQMATYDIAANTWTNTTTPIITGNITSDGSYLYAAVGVNFMRFDPATGTWADRATPPFSFQSWGALVYHNGKIYGHEGNGQTGFGVYSIASNTWEKLPSLPEGAVMGAAIDPVGQHYYAYGSYDGRNLYIYDIPKLTWSIVRIPLFPVNDGGMAFVNARGKRGVYFLQGQEGTGFARFQTASATWLSVLPVDGEVEAGETLNLNANLDAATLFAGEYSATIHISSNDPVSPLVSVPVSLTVTGAPRLTVNPSSMDFGQVFVSAEKRYAMTLKNTGTDVLNVASISSSSSYFTVSHSVTSLDPGKQDSVFVTFKPLLDGAFAGSLFVDTNDPVNPRVTVELSGLALVPPVIKVSPVSITSHLDVNEKEERVLTIQNTGGSPLIVTLRAETNDPADPPIPGSVAQVVPQASPGQNNYNLPETHAPEHPVPLAPGDFSSLPPSPAILTCMTIDPVKKKIYAQQNTGNGFYQYDVNTQLWSSLSSSPVFSGNNGGAVFLQGKVYTVYTTDMRMGIYTVATNSWTTVTIPAATGNITTDGIYIYTVVGFSLYRYDPTSNTWTTLASPPFFYEQWGALVHHKGMLYGHQGNGYSGFAKYSIATNSWTNLPSVPGAAVLGGTIDPNYNKYYTYGGYFGSNLYAFDLNSNLWSMATIPMFTVNDGGLVHVQQSGKQGIYFIQGENGFGFARFETGRGNNWLTLNSESATVDAGASANLLAQIDATGLIGGEYTGVIEINSNDPLTSQVSIPVTLTVTGAPKITVSSTSMNFGHLFIGTTTAYDLTLRNVGTDILTIASVRSNSALFPVSQPAASLNPGEAATFYVSFAPTAAGSHAGQITIQTNDPVTPVVYVNLVGVGVPPPVIRVAPTAISETLVTGTQVTRMLTVQNNGSTDLYFGNVIEFDVPARIFRLSNSTSIQAVDPLSGSIVASIATPEPASGHSDGLAFDGTSLYFTNGAGTQKIYQLDPGNGHVIREQSFPAIQPIDALAHSGNYLYALSYTSGIIYEIDFAAGTILRGIAPGVNMRGGMSFGGQRGTLFVSSTPYIHEIDITSRQVIRTIIANSFISGLGYSNGTGLLYVQNSSTSSTDAYNPDTGELVHSIFTGYSSALASDEGVAPSWLAATTGSSVGAFQSLQLQVELDTEGLAPGEYYASIVFNSNDPLRPVVTVPVTMIVTVPTAIEPDPVVELVLSPNPASQELHASFEMRSSGRITYSLTDLTGKTLWTVSESRDAGQHTITTSVVALPEGLYLFRFANNDSVTTQRVVILRK